MVEGEELIAGLELLIQRQQHQNTQGDHLTMQVLVGAGADRASIVEAVSQRVIVEILLPGAGLHGDRR